MRLVLLVLVSLLLPLGAAIAAPDECEALIDGLLSDNALAREVSEAGLAKADEALLRRLVARLLRRLEDATPGAARDLTPPDPRPHLAPELEDPVDPNAPLVTIEVRLIDADAEAARLLLASSKPGPDGSATFDAQALAAAIAEHTKAGRLTPVTAPRLTTLAGQRADISVLRQISYVQDYEVESVSNVANPVIGIVQEGIVLELRAKPAAEQILMDTKLTLSDVVKPIAEFKTRLAAGLVEFAEVTIQMPELKVQRWERRVSVTPGVPVLLASMDAPDQGPGRRLLVFLEAAVLAGVPASGGPSPAPVR